MVLTQAQLEDLLSSGGSYTVDSGYADLIAGYAIPVRDSSGEVSGFVSPGVGVIDRVVASIRAAGGDVVSIVTGQSVAEPNDALRQQPAGSIEPPAMSTAEKKTMLLKWGLLAAGLWLVVRRW